MSDEPDLYELGRFLASPGALSYADVCAEFGIDPAKDISDDFLAWQMRVGLAALRWNRPQPEADEDTKVRQKIARDKAAMKAAQREMGV